MEVAILGLATLLGSYKPVTHIGKPTIRKRFDSLAEVVGYEIVSKSPSRYKSVGVVLAYFDKVEEIVRDEIRESLENKDLRFLPWTTLPMLSQMYEGFYGAQLKSEFAKRLGTPPVPSPSNISLDYVAEAIEDDPVGGFRLLRMAGGFNIVRKRQLLHRVAEGITPKVKREIVENLGHVCVDSRTHLEDYSPTFKEVYK